VWFRPGDLRVDDHAGLCAAAASAAALCLCASGPRRSLKSLERKLWQRYQRRLIPCSDAQAVADIAARCRAHKVHVHEEPMHSEEELIALSKVAEVVQWSAPLRSPISSLKDTCHTFNDYQEQTMDIPITNPTSAPPELPPEPLEARDLAVVQDSGHENDVDQHKQDGQQLLDAWASNPREFAANSLPDTADPSESKEAWALGRIIKGRGISGLIPGEAFVRTFAPLLGDGMISLRQAAKAAAQTDTSALTALEAKEWHRLLALRDVKQGFQYWRWRGHLIRYTQTGSGPAVLCVHGFAASAEQYTGLMEALSGQKVFALDLLGYGHSEKPPLSYNQYLWEDVVVDFIKEIIQAPCLIIGNSIGGYFAASAACSVPHLCRGLVLMNSAGPLLPTDEWEEQKNQLDTIFDRMKNGSVQGYDPPPQWLIDGFSSVLFSVLFAVIEPSLRVLYPSSPERVTPKLVRNIERDALDPFATVVVGAFPRFPPARSLNELIEGFGGRVLVVNGMADRLGGGPSNQPIRVDGLKACGADAVPLKNVGHCPHDEAPDLVAAAIQEWCVDLKTSVP